MNKRRVYFALSVPLLVGAWYLFRPELLFVKTMVNEEFPAAAPAAAKPQSMPVLSGDFHAVAHDTMGTAAVYELADGKRVLRFTNFQTSNGPDVRVYLVAAPDATDSDTVKSSGYIELAKLKGTEGPQNYDIPAGVDLDRHRAVTIWCARFGVNFGTAPLTPAGSTGDPAVLSSGSFHGVAHDTKGVATLYRLANGKRVLRFTGFETSNGPDVQVYLGKASDATDNESVTERGYVNLGALKGTMGDQNYEVPDDLELTDYHSVTIWCRRFGVNFATAPLKGETT